MTPTPFPPHPIRLAAGQILGITARRGTRFTVRAGSAWLTQEGDDRDVVLNAGRALALDDDGLVVVEMLAGGTLVIEPVDVRPAGASHWLRQLRDCLRAARSPVAVPVCRP